MTEYPWQIPSLACSPLGAASQKAAAKISAAARASQTHSKNAASPASRTNTESEAAASSASRSAFTSNPRPTVPGDRSHLRRLRWSQPIPSRCARARGTYRPSQVAQAQAAAARTQPQPIEVAPQPAIAPHGTLSRIRPVRGDGAGRRSVLVRPFHVPTQTDSARQRRVVAPSLAIRPTPSLPTRRAN